jgi:hypothetical protein
LQKNKSACLVLEFGSGQRRIAYLHAPVVVTHVIEAIADESEGGFAIAKRKENTGLAK